MSTYDFSWMKEAMPKIDEWIKTMWKREDKTVKINDSEQYRLEVISKHLRAAHGEMMIAISKGGLSKEVFDKYRLGGSILISLKDSED